MEKREHVNHRPNLSGLQLCLSLYISHDTVCLENQGVWKADADDGRGQDYELHVDASSGEIEHIEDD